MNQTKTVTGWLRAGDDIQITKDIVVGIVHVERGKVKIGVKAPRDVPVFRSELLDDHEGTPQ